MTTRAMPVATIRRCSHRGGGYFNRLGNMVCGDCGRTVEETGIPTEPVRFEQD